MFSSTHAGSGDPIDSNSGIPQLKGTRRFFFEELQKYTNKFSQDNDIGSGGYGKVFNVSFYFQRAANV